MFLDKNNGLLLKIIKISILLRYIHGWIIEIVLRFREQLSQGNNKHGQQQTVNTEGKYKLPLQA